MDGARRALRWVTCGAIALSMLGGCAYSRGSLARQTDRVVRTETQARREPSPSVHVTQEGTRIRVSAEQLCRPYRLEMIETTSSYSRRSAAPVPMTLAAIAGAAGVTLGSLMAANVFGFPPESAMSDDALLSMEEGLGFGIALIGAGTIAIVVAVAHALGLVGTDDESAQRTVERGPSGEAAPCSPRAPMAGASVMLIGEEDVSLGLLGPSGELSLDAALAIEPAFVLRHAGQRVPLRVALHPTDASIAMDPFQAQVDERVWARAETTRCAAAEAPADCRALERYLELFPSGAHAEQARGILEVAQARLAARAQQREAERLAAEARWRAEMEAQARALEAERREEEAQWERAERARQAQALERQQAAEAESRRREARAQCERECRSACSGNRQCETSCRAQQCR